MYWLLPPLSGVLFALAQPGFDCNWLSYVCLIPLLHFFTRRPSHPLPAFAVFELTRNLLLLTFIPKVMTHYGGMSPTLGFTGWIGLAIFLALLCAPFAALINRVLPMPRAWLLIPLLFAGKDALLEIAFGGFPWCLLAYSQLKTPWLMQWAELGGVHLVGALVVLINLLGLRLLQARNRTRLLQLLAILIIVLSSGALLRRQAAVEIARAGPIKLAVLQPNSSYDNFRGYEPRLTELLTASQELVQAGARAVIWPEYSLPIYPRQWPSYTERFQSFAAANAPLIGGFTDRRGPKEVYNAVMLFDGRTIQQYNKMHLAPFGEYIPFRPLFFFIRRITDEISDFTPGSGPQTLNLLGHRIGLPICYEAIFPGLVQRFVRQGAELLVVTSNDSWYCGDRAHRQLLAMSAARAVENRRTLLRSTSNGISAWVSPLGEIRREIPYGVQDGFIADSVFLSSKTVFTLGGVHFGLACLILCALMAVWMIKCRYFR